MHSILILESDPKVAAILKTQLEKRHFEVTVASNVQAGEGFLGAALPNLLLIDLNTADQFFFPFYKKLQEDSQYRSIPRLFIEGTSRGKLADKIREQSSDPILQKPLRISQLLSQINLQVGKTEESGTSLAQEVVPPSHHSAPPKAPVPGPLPKETNPQDRVNQQLAKFIGKQIGNVILGKEIGRGGMGAVFSGQQTTLKRQVAVKIMLPDLVGESNALIRFRREALAIARLKSPHIVQVFDAGTTNEQVFYIVMEFLEGGTVDDHLQAHKRCSTTRTVDILYQVAKGLRIAHGAGLIHRDLKPSNLMINSSGHVTITDFGLVREHGAEEEHKLTKQGSLLGTPYYLSPEQASGMKLDPRTDLYSLGIIGYELLTGEVPFNSHNLLDILVMHHNMPLPDPRQKVKSGIPEGLVQILYRLTAKKVDERYPDAASLLEDLEVFRNEPNPQLSGVHVRPSFATPLPNTSPRAFQLTTNTDERLHAFSSQSDALLAGREAEGKAVVQASGEILEREGSFPDTWVRALSICVGIVQQLQVISGVGEWKFAQIETPDKLLHVHPHSNMYEAILLKPSFNLHSMNLETQVHHTSHQHAAPDPFIHISSIAGVQAILTMNLQGQIIRSRYNTELDQELIRIRLAPLPQLLNSIPNSFIGIDTTYEKGRVFLWDMDDHILFIITNSNINKTVLTTALASQLAQLKPRQENPRSMSASLYAEISPEESTSPEVMKKLQKVFAHSIGPIAGLTMKKEAKRMGFSRKNFPKEKLSELVEQLGAQLDSSKQQEFTSKALTLLSKENM